MTMKILLLGPLREGLVKFMESFGDDVIQTAEQITLEDENLKLADFIVSFGYRHILNQSVIQYVRQRAINLHISYLPWNRGADPNLWSFLEDSPKGVTIHYLNEGIDTGDILAQEEVAFSTDDTLRTSYDRLCWCIENLFKKFWPCIRTGEMEAHPQPAGGSIHYKKDRAKYNYLLQAKGWDTPLLEILGKANKR
jgi:methionyl-tRNA formyltransferase